MLAGRRTLRRLRQSTAGLAVVSAARLSERDTQPEVARRDDDAPQHWDVRLGEVSDRAAERPAAVSVHVRTIGMMSDDASALHAKRAALTAEQIAELLPGTGEIMHEVGDIWWKCAYAGRAGNWALAAYFARRTRSLLRTLSVLRPKYADDIVAFEGAILAPVLSACERSDRAAFDRAIGDAIDRANELHVKWAHGYIKWTLPPEPPKEFDLTP
jgi:hypothetical protein